MSQQRVPAMPDVVGPSLLTIAEVALFLRVSRAHVSALVNGKVRGVPRLPSARLGRRVLVARASLEEWLFRLDSSGSSR